MRFDEAGVAEEEEGFEGAWVAVILIVVLVFGCLPRKVAGGDEKCQDGHTGNEDGFGSGGVEVEVC